MEKIFFNADQKIQSTLLESKTETETILFPESYLNTLTLEQRKALPKRILSLMKRYQKFLVSKRRMNRKAGKTLYQRDRGKMIRMNMRIDCKTWALLGVISASHGVSRCFMVNYLLWLDDLKVGDSIDLALNVGCPSFHSSYSYIWHLDLTKNKISKRLKFGPNPLLTVPKDSIP
ncbi:MULTISPECIES: DUF1564 domain-containing protein [Leptospira]|uniref:PF07600 family protein n=4 Tax=Leptospira weilii TaxID=28184 RepID=A0A828Z5B1_9LEPT|nr:MULTISPECIES: DUF1564 domain-containing protein [Leptospira]EMM70829.1 PF07600 family protein [Leptospira weilii str. 2006001855]EMY12932.1 PF07600 family protein [Leptospira weilii str. Ecochallenge]EKR65593.1 PF07600 family protein [Leptospira weilii str. 2006001853]EMJ65903.1 PF07600 family protein [Leptospira sp. P2653]EMN42543.1 PF07600 family protein [Leptospira weilii str. LNT 1234]